MLVSGYWILKGNDPFLIQHQVSSIQHLAAYGANVNFEDLLVFGSGLSGLGFVFNEINRSVMSASFASIRGFSRCK